MTVSVPTKSLASKLGHVVIGLTGPIASGKSTVAHMLQEEGADVIDADRVYHELIQQHTPLWNALVERFGSAILGPALEIDRAALANIVFTDPAKLRELEQLTHPAVVSEIRQAITRSKAPIIVVEAVKLVQSGLADEVDAIWLVSADKETRLERLLQRGGLGREQAAARIAASLDVIPVGFQPDVTIDTSGALGDTQHAVAEALRTLVESSS